MINRNYKVLPITFGVHSILSMISLCIILLRYDNNDIVKSMVSTCLVWISLALSECIYILISISFLNIKVERLTDNTTLQGAVLYIGIS